MDSSRDIVRKLRENRILNERRDYEGKSTEELAKLAKEGDQLAFNTLINTHDEFFYKMTKKYIGEGVFERDDIYQIAEIAFWQAVQSWDGSGEFDAYAGMIVKRRLVDEYRKLFTDKAVANRNTRSIEASEEGPEDVGDQYGEMNKSEFDSWMSQQSRRSAEDEYIDQAMEAQLIKFFKENMTETERKMIGLYIKGYKMSQIAEETGMKYKSCENAVRRAKEKVREYLAGMKESKMLREGNESIFSDEEKKILTRVLNKIEEGKLNESKSLDDMTQEEIEEELSKIEDEIDKLTSILETTRDHDDYTEAMYQAEELQNNLSLFEEYIESDELKEYWKEVYRQAQAAVNIDSSNLPYLDPYEEAGMRRDDFF